jgi:hypothetical protein
MARQKRYVERGKMAEQALPRSVHKVTAQVKHYHVIAPLNKRSHFAGGVMTPPLTKGDARPLWKPHNFVPASRGSVYLELTNVKIQDATP